MNHPFFTIIRNEEAIEKFYMKGLEISLLASHDGTEIIHHKLLAHNRWVLVPEENWTALEYIRIISGQLIWKRPEGDVLLHPGDSFYGTPVNEHARFETDVDTEFLYVVSRQVFHHYSKLTKEMLEKAIEVEEKDGYTADHCQRIANLSLLIGEKLGLSPIQMNDLSFAAFLHDIGKIKIPLEILNKPAALNQDEWELMKNHPIFGKEILEQCDYPPMRASGRIVEQHHERYDGKGYPYQLKGDEIDISAAIISVADSYDAMTFDRVYRKALTKEEAVIEILKNKGTMYHPKVVDVFLSLIDKLHK
jgi:HD-GYP domain-containing protein (c-di-GMP phosphodiesterase class II)